MKGMCDRGISESLPYLVTSTGYGRFISRWACPFHLCWKVLYVWMYGVTPHLHSLQEMKNKTGKEIFGSISRWAPLCHGMYSCAGFLWGWEKNCHDNFHTQGHDNTESFYQTLQSKLQGEVIQPSNTVEPQMFVDLQTKLLTVTEEYLGWCVTCVR